NEHEGSGIKVPAPAGASTNARFVVHAAGHDVRAHTHRDDSKVVPVITHTDTTDAHACTSDVLRDSRPHRREANAQDEHEGSGLTVPAPAGASTNARFVVHAAGHDVRAHTHRDDSKVVPVTTHGKTADAHVRTSDMPCVFMNASRDGVHILTPDLCGPGDTQTGRAAQDLCDARTSPALNDRVDGDAADEEQAGREAEVKEKEGKGWEQMKRDEEEGRDGESKHEHNGSKTTVPAPAGVSTNSEFVVRTTGHGPRAYTHRDDSGVVPATVRVNTADARTSSRPGIAEPRKVQPAEVTELSLHGYAPCSRPAVLNTARLAAPTNLFSHLPPCVPHIDSMPTSGGSGDTQGSRAARDGPHAPASSAPQTATNVRASPASRTEGSADAINAGQAGEEREGKGYVTAKNEEEEGREANGQDEHEGSEPKGGPRPRSAQYIQIIGCTDTFKFNLPVAEGYGHLVEEVSDVIDDHDEHESSEHSEDDPDHQGDQDYETDSVVVEDYYETDSVVVEDYYETGDVVVEDYYESDSGSADDYDDYESEDPDYYSE
ncbi:hypothetical protein EVJ58_g11060, partial [Rhodofomes roseus]